MSGTSFLTLKTTNPTTEETVYAELNEAQAWAVAQFLKRISFSECRVNAVDDDEAYLMTAGLAKLQSLFAGAGIAPR